MAEKSKLREWPSVTRFADEMVFKLEENNEKGGREDWLTDDLSELLKRLKEEVAELEEFIELEQKLPPSMRASAAVMEQLTKQATREAADVGNFAMMIADKLGGLGK